jgi:hypothetical protein
MVKYLTKAMLSTGGATVAHHGITRYDLAADLTTLLVHLDQWPDEAARLAGTSATGKWLVRLEVAALNLAGGLEAAVHAGLLQDAAFAGGAWAAGADGTVANAKARRWADIKAERARRLTGTFRHAGKGFDLDQPAIEAAAAAAARALAAGLVFPKRRWVLANNTTTRLDAAELAALADACDAEVTAIRLTAQDLREALAAIDDATGTLEQVAAVQWPA